MTQLGEMVAVVLIQSALAKCPFEKKNLESPAKEPEHIAKDDLEAAHKDQDNNGGKLGTNLTNASPGPADTITPIFPSRVIPAQERIDSKTRPGVEKVSVEGDDGTAKQWDYKVAAHHLIPGEASLHPSDVYTKYMVEGGEIETPVKKRKYKIKANIGYNVNGNHNGVWLPGNYAIREGHSPKSGAEATWSKIVDDPKYKEWCFDYVMACVAKVGGQFHDSHTEYNKWVLNVLNEIATKIIAHQDVCEEACKNETELYPPYILKQRLYLFSNYLKSKVKQVPGKWKAPWFTSDKFLEMNFERGNIHYMHITTGYKG
jgi:hypothetical protein